MEHPSIKKNNKLLNVARILRRNMTRQEKHLWYDFLQRYPVKIYKQRIIDNFIADFYCHSARLVIAEESRTLSVFAGKNSPLPRQNFLQYPHIASKFFLAATNFCTAETAKHLSANEFLVDFFVTGRSKVRTLQGTARKKTQKGIAERR